MNRDWVPKVHARHAPEPPRPIPVQQPPMVLQVENLVQKQQSAPRGWRFVPVRDSDNLIVEIIATPIE